MSGPSAIPRVEPFDLLGAVRQVQAFINGMKRARRKAIGDALELGIPVHIKGELKSTYRLQQEIQLVRRERCIVILADGYYPATEDEVARDWAMDPVGAFHRHADHAPCTRYCDWGKR